MDRADISNLDKERASNLLKCLDQLVAVVGLERNHFEENCSVDNQSVENDLAKTHSMENRLMVIYLAGYRLMENHFVGNHFAG